MRWSERRKTLIACLALAGLIAMPGVAQAGDDKADATEPDTTTETTVPEHEITEVLSTLPVLGSGLNVTITRDDRGKIASVALDPDTGATVVKEKDHKVVFLLGDGETQVVVKSRGHSVQTKVRSNAVENVAGPGSWSADVFGTGPVTIPYEVSFDGITPTVTIGAVTAPDGVTVEIGEPKTRTDEDGDKASFKIKVRLATEDDRAKVSFVVKTRVNDDGEIKVSLSVTASERHRHRDRDHDDDRDKWNRGDGDDDGKRRDRDRDRGDDERGRDNDRGGDDDHGRGGGDDGDDGGGDN
jgi:hypothetical protein